MPEENTVNPLPYHVAIIPDGNRRWAKEHGLEPWEGHEAGAKTTEKLVREARKLGIRELSLWGSSIENLTKRPLSEKKGLLRIYETHFKELLESKDIHEDQVKLSFIGHWEEQFPESLKKLIQACIDTTKNYNEFHLNFFLAYSGDDEMLLAVERVAKILKPGERVTPELLQSQLMTKDIPPVDLLIRTGGDPHLSAGFMMWQMANAELYFSTKYYPDFDEACLRAAMDDYAQRGRRFGK